MQRSKLGVTVERSQLEFLTRYREAHQLASPAEVVAQALTLLQERELEEQYAAAIKEWQAGSEGEVWEGVVGDGLNAEAETRWSHAGARRAASLRRRGKGRRAVTPECQLLRCARQRVIQGHCGLR